MSATVSLDVRTLSAMSSFASVDPTRPVLNGVCLQIENNECLAIASDGRVLAAYECGKVDGERQETIRVIVPTNEILRLNKIAKAAKDYRFSFAISSSDAPTIAAKLGELDVSFDTVLARIPKAQFPNWCSVWPKTTASGSAFLNVDSTYLSRIHRALVELLEVKAWPSRRDKTKPVTVRIFQENAQTPARFYSPLLAGFAGILCSVSVEPKLEADGGEAGLLPKFVKRMVWKEGEA